MNFWDSFPTHRLMTDVSLWSADFTCLREEIRRIDPFVDLYHIDVSDAHFVPGLLLFPDLVAALRPLTTKPFHAHLMVHRPESLVGDFAAAGVDLITVQSENGPLAHAAVQTIRAAGLNAGLALGLDAQPEAILPFLDNIDLVLMLGTAMGIKGVGLSPLACPRITRVKELLRAHGLQDKIKVEADGGIRSHTVASLRAAGTDLIVPGSLAFKSEDTAATFDWIHSLAGPQFHV